MSELDENWVEYIEREEGQRDRDDSGVGASHHLIISRKAFAKLSQYEESCVMNVWALIPSFDPA